MVQVGEQAPDFTATAVVGQRFARVSLADYRDRDVVLFFYPLDFTFVCPGEVMAFSDRQAEFAALGCDLLGVSVDSEYAHLAWIQTPREQGGVGELAYPLISDLNKSISERYGVLTPAGVALRALFIIDRKGIIQHSTINNLNIGRSVDEALRTLQAVQHVATSPNRACPIDWQPGNPLLKLDAF